MEHQKMLNLLNEPNDPKFVTIEWNIVNDQPSANFDLRTEIIYNTEILKSNLCDCNDTYILVKGDIVTTAYNIPIQVALKFNHANV